MILHELRIVGDFMKELKEDKDRGLLDVNSPGAIEISENLKNFLEKLDAEVKAFVRGD